MNNIILFFDVIIRIFITSVVYSKWNYTILYHKIVTNQLENVRFKQFFFSFIDNSSIKLAI